MNSTTIFGKRKILPGNTEKIQLGCSQLVVAREKEGWQIGLQQNCADPQSQETNPKMIFFQTGKSHSLVIAPALPTKPLVFKESKINLLPGQKLNFFIKIPLTFQVYSSKALPGNLLKEIEYRRLSDTWFGEPDNGEAAFALGSEYFLDMEKMETAEFEAICPILMKNNSPSSLEVQRLIIRAENLALYRNEQKIVTSLVQIEYKGQDVISSATYHYSKQFNGEKQEIVAKPRNETGKNILKVNFHFIKNIYKTEQ